MKMRRKPLPLARVTDPAGRVDVAAYRAAERLLERCERDYQLVGLRENLLPVIENAILSFDLPAWKIPPEVKAIVNVLQQNRRRL